MTRTELQTQFYKETGIEGVNSQGDPELAYMQWLEDKVLGISRQSNTIGSLLPEYEYEMFFDSEPNEMIQIHGWFPIATDRIRHPEKIEHYIKTGLLRKACSPKNIVFGNEQPSSPYRHIKPCPKCQSSNIQEGSQFNNCLSCGNIFT